MTSRNPFFDYQGKADTQPGLFSTDEVRLANRNSGILLEALAEDITPTGLHYLLNHFDVPLIGDKAHRLTFGGAFANPMTLTMDDIRALPRVTMPVTLECAGNGRSGVTPRSHSMPWSYEAVGTSEWTGTPLRPLIEQAGPSEDVIDVSFTGADRGFDGGVPHDFGRSLTMGQLTEPDVLLVYEMNGQPLLPQHGAPLRIVVPGWYGMASVKWLTRIEALTTRYQGYQQVQTYQHRAHEDDPGVPITTMRVKSLMVPPGVPDWSSRMRFCEPGHVTIRGRAWSGGGVPIDQIEFSDGSTWTEATLSPPAGPYAWTGWQVDWTATEGHHTLRCRARDANGAMQPLDPPFDIAGFANNAAQKVEVFVGRLPSAD
jgi:DMSO/TMAO reductase YedYZ molybdopterin-dependent catalytic subunit